MPEATTSRAEVGVYPAVELTGRRRLLDALESAYPVRFVEHQAVSAAELEGLIVFGDELPAELPPGTPTLQMPAEERRATPTALRLGAMLEPPLRGASLSDSFVGVLGDVPGSPLAVLAAANGRPVWVEDTPGRLRVAGTPAELEPEEPLRMRLVPGRCLGLLSIVHLLRRVLGDRHADAGPLRAAFVFDDPNLHWPSYGHMHFRRLAAHAREHAYHAVIAMVPLDGWFAHSGVVRTFAEHRGELSICVHGDDHHGAELGRIADEQAGVAVAARALKRSAAFGSRTGLAVDHVMVPPHEELSEFAARGLLAADYEAVCVSRPYPWIRPIAPFAAPAGRGALSGWGARELIDGGLPVLLRAGFNAPLEDLVLRAYLGQPLILYGHHDLLADGLEPLARASAAINVLGDICWGGLASIARAGIRTRRSGELLEVELLARQANVRVPEGVRELALDCRPLGAGAQGCALTISAAGSLPGSVTVEGGVTRVAATGPGLVELRLGPQLNNPSGPPLRTGPSALLRRLASEARDRISGFGPRRQRG